MKELALATNKVAVVVGFALIAGCATPPPRPRGAIVPMEGGNYQSAVKSGDQPTALKIFASDAEITCAKGAGKSRMPWESKPDPGRYVVVSQNVKMKEAKDIKSDNKMLDAGIAVGLRQMGLEGKDEVEVTTVFKCE